MKIGIISEFNINTVNYGNHLQAYALNRYLRSLSSEHRVESVLLHGKLSVKYTGIFSLSFCRKLIWGVLRRLRDSKGTIFEMVDLSGRQKLFEAFRRQHIPMSPKHMTTDDLRQSDYDAFIVGSDVVWAQGEHRVTRTKFLDFSGVRGFQRIAYAASFSHDYLPKENIRTVRRYLRRFNALSVRERSSVNMLAEIGVPDVEYCVDPTLLISPEEWKQLEQRPKDIPQGEKFLFAYLLGKDKDQREAITTFARECEAKIVTIPYADGHVDTVEFGDILQDNCSIENWLWLIHHAQMVITDSFHGIVFSTIFHKPFYAVDRVCEVDINNRIYDYLREINQSDKLIQRGDLLQNNGTIWDYEEIENALEIRRKASKAFLRKALGVIGE